MGNHAQIRMASDYVLLLASFLQNPKYKSHFSILVTFADLLFCLRPERRAALIYLHPRPPDGRRGWLLDEAYVSALFMSRAIRPYRCGPLNLLTNLRNESPRSPDYRASWGLH